ncbi:hypothetical protein [Streptomyces sp. RG80]|uniref:hypothetical protein n=1 Tax=Streptomyces sp. RG80 TaxID=3157340 RepID=UPI00338F81F9
MSDYIHCPSCPKGKAYSFRKVDKAEEKYIATVRPAKDAPGYFRCQGETAAGQCLWVQPRWNQGKGFRLPPQFS